MTTLNITVFNNKVLIDNPVIIPEGNLNTVFAVFDLPDEWNGLTAKVKFGDIAPITIPSSKTVAIPLFAIKGDVPVKVFAYSLVNDEYSLIHSPAPSQMTICEGSFDTDGETPIPPTPATEYLDKTTLWGGYSAYFGSLTDVPAEAVTEFESVDITSMTLEEVVTEIEVINKIILDDIQIDSDNIVLNAITENKLATNSVSTNKIKDGNVTKSKLSQEVISMMGNAQTSNLATKGFVNYIAYSHTNASPHTINTEAEYIYNCNHGYTSIKGDMRLTSDGKIIMCHDTGFTFDQNGKITTFNSSNNTPIHSQTYSYWMSKQYIDGSYVCDFDTYIRICKTYGRIAMFDLRYEYVDDTITAMFKVLDKYGMRGNVIVACNAKTPAVAVRNADSLIKIAFECGKSDDVSTTQYGMPVIKKRIDTCVEIGNCIGVGFDFPVGVQNRNGVSALSATFNDGNGNMVTAPEYATANGVLYYECVIVNNKEDNVDVIDACIKKGVSGFVTEDVVPDYGYNNTYVTTDTEQCITATKTFRHHSEYQGVTTDTNLEVNPYHVLYNFTKEDANNSNNSAFRNFIVEFPSNIGDTYIEVIKDDESCEYTVPRFENGETFQIATTADIDEAVDSDKFTVTFSQVNGAWTCDKTFAEIESALLANKKITVKADYSVQEQDVIFYYDTIYYSHSSGMVSFGSSTVTSSIIVLQKFTVTSSNVVTFEEGGFGKTNQIVTSQPRNNYVPSEAAVVSYSEALVNKVTTIDTSSPSATEYPSEKAVVDYINSLRGSMNLTPPEKIYYEKLLEDITSRMTYMTETFQIESTGDLVNNPSNKCYKCSVSQYTPVKIYTASRSLSWYSYAFYSSDSDFNSSTFISGGKVSTASSNSNPVFNWLTVGDIPANAVTMLITCYYNNANFLVYGYDSNKIYSVSECVTDWLANGSKNSVIFKIKDIPTHIYRVGIGRTPSTTEFTSLIDAVAQWGTDGKPCATMFVDSGTYITQNDPTGPSNPLTINGGENRLTIIGEDKDTTIVKSTTGKYIHPAINIQGGNVTIKNITFIADHSDNSSFAYLDPDREANGKQPNSAYAVHCDGGDSVDIVSGVIEFENCNMWSWQSCGLGCGTVVNGHVVVKNCDIRSFVPGTATDEGSTAQDATAEQKEAHAIYEHGARGAIVYHTTSDDSAESFSLYNTNVYLKGGTKTARITCDSQSGYKMVTFVDNTFYNEIEECNIVPLSENHHLNTLSVSNNISNLNSLTHEQYIKIE